MDEAFRNNVPRLLQVHTGAFEGLAQALLEEFSPQVVLLATGADVSRCLGERLADELEVTGVGVELHCELRGSLDEAARLADHLDGSGVSLVVAVGGGQPIDVAKLAAFRAGVELVAVPTALSHDGMSSPVASLWGPDGVRRSLGTSMPAGVVIDLAIVGAAPDRYVRAGIGDLVSNLTAVDDWRRAQTRGGEPFDELAASIALLGAKAAMEVAWPLAEDDLATVARGLVLSGFAMAVAGSSRPCSGAEHLVSHALDQVRGVSACLHGEHVAIGVLLACVMQQSSHAERIRRLFARVGFPLSLNGWQVDEATLVEAIQLAPTTRPGRSTVLDDVDLSSAGVRRLIHTAFTEDVR